MHDILYAASRGQVGVLNKWLDAPRGGDLALLGRQDQHGKSLLHLLLSAPTACLVDDSDLIATIEWKEQPYQTLYRETQRRKYEVDHLLPLVQRLLAAMPPLANTSDLYGATPLHIAAWCGHKLVLRELLKLGADPLQSTNRGQRAIDDAAHMGDWSAVDILLDALTEQRDHAAARREKLKLDEYAALPGAALLPRRHRRARAKSRVQEGMDQSSHSTGKDGQGPSCDEGGDWRVEQASLAADNFCDLDVRGPDLTANELMSKYFLRGRPVLIRRALSLSERCTNFSRGSAAMQSLDLTRRRLFACGRLPYPRSNGQKYCGLFSLDDLDHGRTCSQSNGTTTDAGGGVEVPICAKTSLSSRDPGSLFPLTPPCFQRAANLPPITALQGMWAVGGNRQLFAGGRGSGTQLHCKKFRPVGS
jgi:hypothetical protein